MFAMPQHQQQVYDFDKWASHRSTRRYLRHVLGMFNSRIVAGLQFPLTFIGTTATLLCIYETLLTQVRATLSFMYRLTHHHTTGPAAWVGPRAAHQQPGRLQPVISRPFPPAGLPHQRQLRPL